MTNDAAPDETNDALSADTSSGDFRNNRILWIGLGVAAILANEGTPPAAMLDRRHTVLAQVYDRVVDGAWKAIARAPASAALRATVRAAHAGLDARYRRGLDGAAGRGRCEHSDPPPPVCRYGV